MIEDSGVFVLFGSKPLSEAGFLNDVMERPNSPYKRNLFKGWEAWEKIKKNIDVSQYILLKKTKKIRLLWPGEKERRAEQEFQEFIFLDVQKTAYVLAENYEFFRKFVGMDFHPLEVVFDIENPDSPFWNKIFKEKPLAMYSPEWVNAQMIAGLLYGFGEKNVLMWTWKQEFESREGKVAEFVNKAPFRGSSNDDALGNFRTSNLNCLDIPGFIAFEGDETVEMYNQEKKKIQQIYRGKDFLEVTLRQLSKQAAPHG